MIRWDFLKKGDEYFFGAKPAPSDFHVLYLGNKCHAAFTRAPENDEWLVIFNGEFYKSIVPGICRSTRLSSILTIEEAKAEVVRLCQHSS